MNLTESTRFLALVFALLSSGFCRAQDWQTPYQAALQFYQQEDYNGAMREAEKAILASADPKGQAYSRQIFTASCLALENYEKGFPEVLKEIENFKALEPTGEHYLEAIHKKGQFQMGTGSFQAAAETFHQLSRLHGERSGLKSYPYFVALAEEADALMQAKKFNEAQEAYASCIAGFRSFPDAGEDYLYALFNSGYIDYTQSNLAPASQKLSGLVAFLEKNNLQSYPQYEEARQMLSRINTSGQVKSTGLILPADEARQLFEKAYAIRDKNLTEALEHYRACEQIIAEHQLLSNTSFSCYLNYARLHYAMGVYQESAAMLAKARDHAAKLYQPDSPEGGHVQILTGDLALHAQNVKSASQLYQQGIKNLKPEGSAVWVKQIQWVSEQLIAAKAAQEAIAIISFVFQDEAYAQLGVREKIIVNQLHGRAHLEARQSGKLTQFLKPLLEREKNVDLRQTYLLLSAQAAREEGRINDAQRFLLSGIALASGGMVAGELYFESARAYQQLGDFKEAEIHYRKALEYIANAPSSETVTPQLFNSLATFYIQLGNYGAAEKFFLNLLADDDGSTGFYNAVRQNLAALYQQTGRYPEAKKLLLKTLASDALQGTDHPDYAVALQNLAAVYENLHELDSAQLLYEQALEIDKKQFGEKSLSFATKLANLGVVFQEAGNFAAARGMFEQALAIRKELLSADHPDYAYSQYVLANLLYRTQNPREALPLFKASADFYVRQIHDVFPALSDYERTAFYNRVYEIISAYEMFLLENIHLEKGLAATLLNFRLQTKALLLNSSLKVRNQILQSGNPSLISDFNVWQHTKEQLAYLFSLTKEERTEHAALIEEFSQQANALEKSLSLQSEHFSSAFVPPAEDWRQVQAVLKPGEAAIEIIRVKLENRDSVLYAALVAKPGIEEPVVVIMPDGNFLEQKAFNGYINSIRYRLQDARSYDRFWKKLEPVLLDLHTVYLSPDGVYMKINCATLYDPVAKKHLIDRKRIMLVSNLQDLTGKAQPTPMPAHALLVGFPDFRLDASKSLNDFPSGVRSTSLFTDVFKSSFDELPGTETEIKQIQELLVARNWNIDTHLRADALEENIKASKNVTLLHIATHGFFVAPKDEHAKQVYSSDLKDIENSSMLRSGLLLAGAEKNLVAMRSGKPKSQADDGILTAYDVMNLNLDHADLVVLSACETGTGDVKNGEGVYGLQRAFLLAGAKHVVMSLWKVDDAGTQQLMAEFYQQWLGGKEKLNAFHDAQVRMKEKFPHPYFWGAFVMMEK